MMANGVEWEKKVERELGSIQSTLESIQRLIQDHMKDEIVNIQRLELTLKDYDGKNEIDHKTLTQAVMNLEIDSAVSKKVARVWAIITSTAFLGCVEGVKLWLTMS